MKARKATHYVDAENPQSNIADANGPVAFAKWIGEQMNKDSWFNYSAKTGTWYWHMKGHLTTKELYKKWMRARMEGTEL